MIEADVHISRDGRLVMMHDSTLDRTTDGHGPVSGLTWSELAELDAGGWFGEDFADLRIPTTEDTIELARDAGIWMCFEVKGGTPAESEEIANALVRLLVAQDALGFAAMSGYNHDVLAIAKRYAPELVLAPERLPDDVPLDPEIAIGQARALGAPIIQIHHRFLTAGLVDTLHEAGIAVWSWPTTEGRRDRQQRRRGCRRTDGRRRLADRRRRRARPSGVPSRIKRPRTPADCGQTTSTGGVPCNSRCRPTRSERCRSSRCSTCVSRSASGISRSRPEASRPLRT